MKNKCPSWRRCERPAACAVKGAQFAFIGAKRRPLTGEARGRAQRLRRKGRGGRDDRNPGDWKIGGEEGWAGGSFGTLESKLSLLG